MTKKAASPPAQRAVDLLGPSGPIAKAHAGYESRPQQLAMAAAVEEALAAKRHAVLEAGTGVGKSFAYLVPAVCHAASADRPAIVCTSTISLQEQIVFKDLPFLEKALPVRFSYALMKGRGNYLCMRRLDQAKQGQADLFERAEDADALGRVVAWARDTKDGSLSDLESSPPFAVWDRVKSEHENCLGKNSPHYHRCFYQIARRNAQQANVLVVNYALYFADLALRREGSKFLPDHSVVVFDEAHEVEAIAAEHLGVQVTYFQVKHLLDGLVSPAGRKGLLRALRAGSLTERLVEATRDAADHFFEAVLAWTEARAPENLRIHKKAFVPDGLSPALRELSKTLAGLTGLAKTEGEASELTGCVFRTERLADAVEDIVLQKSPGQVYWAEVTEREGSLPRIALKCCPIDVAPVLREQLFKQRDSVICTSATLATARAGGFDFFRRAVGVPDGAVERRVDSPFNYREQVRLVLCPKLPDPNDRDAFLPAAAAKIVKYVRATQGRSFVLFTSYDLMRALRDRTAPVLAEWGIRILLQGQEVSRHRMLQEFKAAEGLDLALFGVDSFWQGVDVPGPALSTVIITRLPFSVPSHPVAEAKTERIVAAGESPFEELFLPEAILMLKQGFGRLVRRKDDQGTVVVLDARMVKKAYGRRFLAALPACRVAYED